MHRDAKALANETTVIKPPAVVGDGGGWLVVDDLIDTGRTAKVPIYAKPLGRALVNTYVTEVSQDTWIYSLGKTVRWSR